MKKISILAIFAAGTIFFGCKSGDGGSGSITDITVDQGNGIAFHNDTLCLLAGSTYQLNIHTQGSGKVMFGSNNSNVFTINNSGLITAKGAGYAKVLLSGANGDEYTVRSCIVEVWSFTVNSTYNDTYTTLASGSTLNCSSLFTVLPSNQSGRLEYVSDNESILSIDSEGKLIPNSKGQAKVRVKVKDTEIVSGGVLLMPLYTQTEVSKTGWTATASSSSSTTYSPDKIFDGSTTTEWRPASGGIVPSWVLIDMKAVKSFDKIGLHRTTSAYAKTVKILLSAKDQDGVEVNDESFTEAATLLFPSAAATNTLYYGNGMNSKYSARYIKLEMSDTYNASNMRLAQIYLYNAE